MINIHSDLPPTPSEFHFSRVDYTREVRIRIGSSTNGISIYIPRKEFLIFADMVNALVEEDKKVEDE
jgi:hypothetical protein